MSNFIGVYDNLAPEDYCNQMIEELESLINNDSCNNDLGENANGGLDIRKDASRYFNRDCEYLAQETNQILNRALQLYQDEYPSLGMNTFYSNIVKVQKTPPKGGFHKWHCEQGPDVQNAARCLVWMIYLNDTPDGEGTTEFLEQGVRLQPKKGTVVLFPAAWTHTHRGNPVYTCDKYITTGWYYLS
jgi:hypothetical protein